MRLLLLSLACATTALAAPRKPVAAFFPPVTGAPPLALLLEARASELVEQTGKFNQLHLKQTLRAIDEESLKPGLSVDALRLAVGADKAVAFSLAENADGYVLTGFTSRGKAAPAKFELKLPASWSAALEQGSARLAQELTGAPLKKGATAQPSSANDDALKALGACYATVLSQPLAVDTPALVDGAQLEAAVASCEQALKLDPTLRFAHAAAALGQAILGNDAAAAKSLAGLGDADDVVEVYTLARFWLLTRYQSNEAGIAYLKEVLKKHDGELIARAYLGDTQLALGQWADAESTFRAYAALAPSSSWAQGRLSKALARQGNHEGAIAAAKNGLQLSPDSAEARLQLGSRFIDAGKLPDALSTLEPLASAANAKAEHLLRLGWAHWQSGKADAALAHFQRAYDQAQLPGEWRTKGRAAYDLALLQVKRGDPAQAKELLAASQRTGWRTKEFDPALKDVARALEREELGAAAPKKEPSAKPPRETSVLPLTLFGEVDPYPKRPPPPEGLVLFRF